MGWWNTRYGIIGDPPADLCDQFLKDVEAMYLEQTGRLPTQGELANLLEFCTAGVLLPKVADPAFPWSKARCIDDETPRAAPRGEQGIDSEPRPEGCLANVDPRTGENMKIRPEIPF